MSSSEERLNGDPNRTETNGLFNLGIGNALPKGQTASLPSIATGTIVAPVARAILEIPGLP